MYDPREIDAFRARTRGNIHQALSIIEECIDSAKDDLTKSYYLRIFARFNEDLLRYSVAIDAYENAILIDRSPFSLLNYAEFLVRQNRKSEAQSCLAKAVELIASLKENVENGPAAHWATEKFNQINSKIDSLGQ